MIINLISIALFISFSLSPSLINLFVRSVEYVLLVEVGKKIKLQEFYIHNIRSASGRKCLLDMHEFLTFQNSEDHLSLDLKMTSGIS